jgi:hypothetical protein
MSRIVWFARVNDALVSTDEDSRKVIERLDQAECKAFEPVGVRDPVAHKRYWALMNMVGKHVKRIEIDRIGKQPVYMRIFDKDSAHNAMKLCTGHYDTLPVGSTDYAIRVPRSTDFRSMTPEEWALYFPKVLDVIVEKAAPEVETPEARDEMLMCAERWHREAA